MRRWLTRVGLAGALLGLVAACGRPAGVDGELTDDWPAVPAAEVWRPKPGDCHPTSLSVTAGLALYRPVDCAEGHEMETVHVGEFTGADAWSTPPVDDSPPMRKAYQECTAKAREFLGDHWRAGRVWLQVGKPNGDAWTGGARWFRCDLWEFGTDEDADSRTWRTGSLRGTLAENGPLRFGCYMITEKNDKIEARTPAACTKPHNGEFAGVYVAKDVTYPKNDDQEWNILGKGCYGVIARFAGLKDDSVLPRRINFVYTLPGERNWARGDRSVLCTLYLDRNVSKSMKGAGPSAFPAR